MESSTKFDFTDTSRGTNQASRALEPLMGGYPVLRDEPVPDYTIMMADCEDSTIALAVSKLNFTGPGVPNGTLSFPFKRVCDAWVGCPTDAQKQVVTLTGQSDTCCDSTFRKGISIEYWDGVQYQQQYFERVFVCDGDSEMTEANRVQALVDIINADANAVVVATRSTANLVLTAKVAGVPFKVQGAEGFINETLTTPNIEFFGTGAHLLRKGFDAALVDLTADYNVISFVVEEKVDVANGPMGGSYSSARPYMLVEKNVWVAFASDCSTLRTTLLGILNGTATAAQYLDRVATDNCNNPTVTPTPSPTPTPTSSA